MLERGLAAELTGHLGYEKGDPAGRGVSNSRNGTTPKRLGTEVGDIDLNVPRDRASSFEPRLVPNGSRRSGGLDEMIISLYAGCPCIGALDGVMVGVAVGPSALTAVQLMPVSNHL